MGGCATKPKDFDHPPATLPSENSTSREAPTVNDEVIVKENNGGEIQKEELLVDLSEPKQETPQTDAPAPAEPKNEVAELVSMIGNQSEAEPKKTEENVGVVNAETAEGIKDVPGGEIIVEKKDETQKSDVVGDKHEILEVKGKNDETQKSDVLVAKPAISEVKGDSSIASG
ncbi:hypothetical protein GIB67_033225 [Kingdonia uniflora]|uniref:Uncharacterized protein n=1 Tax=Kingdonia uniflora TaxID=39325 RepID=A0A7J7MPE1_9MAGN|nr:hypothetical protein GIB67_033225 [Kingdonia uniflora]